MPRRWRPLLTTLLVAPVLLLAGEEIDQQGCEAASLQTPRDVLVAPAEPAAAAAVGKDHDPLRLVRDRQKTAQPDGRQRHLRGRGLPRSGYLCDHHAEPPAGPKTAPLSRSPYRRRNGIVTCWLRIESE